MFFDSKAMMIAAVGLFVLAISAVPMYASDTTTTEVGAQVEQVMQIAPAGNAEGGLDATGMAVETVEVLDDATAQSVNDGGDSISITINPTNVDATSAEAVFDDVLAVKSNAEFDLSIKPDTSVTAHSNGNLDYTGSESATKPLSDITVTLNGIGGSSTGGEVSKNDQATLNDDGSTALLSSNLAADDYTSDGNGLDFNFVIDRTQPANMPAGNYRAQLIWSIAASN